MGSLCSQFSNSEDDDYNLSHNNRRLFGRQDFLKVITNRNIKLDYEITKDIGKGSFASVKLATNRKTGVQEVVK